MLGLILGDVFETDKGCYVVVGICFKGKERSGVKIAPYTLRKTDPGKFLSDEDIENNWSKIKYKRNLNN